MSKLLKEKAKVDAQKKTKKLLLNPSKEKKTEDKVKNGVSQKRKKSVEAKDNENSIKKTKVVSIEEIEATRKLPSKKKSKRKASNVVYLGHIPHGFFETEMRNFFKQFGTVKRIKLFRSTLSGRSKGYAFVEFEDPEVAKLVSETMNGYFLFERQLKSNLVPLNKINNAMFQKDEIKPKRENIDVIEEEDLTDGLKQKKISREVEKINKKQKLLKAKGFEFEILP